MSREKTDNAYDHWAFTRNDSDIREKVQQQYMDKLCKCVYDKNYDDPDGNEVLHIRIPSGLGDIDYVFQHCKDERIKADNWRIGGARCVRNGRSVSLTERGEWEFAVWIAGHGLSGGILHGYEITDSLRIYVDGTASCFPAMQMAEMFQECSDTETPSNSGSSDESFQHDCIGKLCLDGELDFSELVIEEESTVFDCVKTDEVIGKHLRRYSFLKNGVDISQNFTWNDSYDIDRAYMAMFPISKRCADYVILGESSEKISLKTFVNSGTVAADKAVTFKETDWKSQLTCGTGTEYNTESHEHGIDLIKSVFEVREYPCDRREFFASDNNGRPYYKMYFPVCRNAKVEKGEVWTSVTHYCFSFL